MTDSPPSPSDAEGLPQSGAGSSSRSGPGLSDLLDRNLRAVQSRLDAASDDGPAPTLIAVTKSVDAEVSLALSQLMAQPANLGENRADRLDEKRTAFDEAGQVARWHFIGHIQRNKARRILEQSDVLHSIDSLRLSQTIARLSGELQRPIEVFIEVNLTGETEKHGLAPEGVRPVLDVLKNAEFIQVAGLMAMGPVRGLRAVEDVFSDVAALAEDLQRSAPDAFLDGRCRLSMGMSGDLDEAVRSGSSYVRVGSALFEGLPLAGAAQQGQDLNTSSSQESPR